LITEKVPLANYNRIYSNMRNSSSIASILVYEDKVDASPVVTINERFFSKGEGVIGIVGAGNFTSATVLPALKPLGAKLKYIVSAGGLTASTLAKRAGLACASTDYKQVLNDDDVDLVMITTRHNQHASMVIESLQAGKNVFVEKPLCLNEEELTEIDDVYQSLTSTPQPPTLTVGFNRRFSLFSQKMKSLLGQGTVNIVATMNAGEIPASSWVHDLEVGGGRIVGESCHFIDFCSYLTGSKVVAVCMNAMGTSPEENTDNASILLRYENGSTAVINYFANGNKSYAKERIEAHSQGRSLIIDNWRSLEGFGFKGFSKLKGKQDKGHAEQFKLLIKRLKSGGEALIPYADIVNTTKASFAAIRSLKEGRWVDIE
jgi:predicted dehydrogenase